MKRGVVAVRTGPVGAEMEGRDSGALSAAGKDLWDKGEGSARCTALARERSPAHEHARGAGGARSRPLRVRRTWCGAHFCGPPAVPSPWRSGGHLPMPLPQPLLTLPSLPPPLLLLRRWRHSPPGRPCRYVACMYVRLSSTAVADSAAAAAAAAAAARCGNLLGGRRLRRGKVADRPRPTATGGREGPDGRQGGACGGARSRTNHARR